jgi:DNA-binding transcriptional regulator YiaG
MEAFDLAVSRELGGRAVCTGEALRFMRSALGLRAADLARLLDVTPETMSHWETGKAPVPRSAFAVVAALVDDAAEGRTATRARLERLASSRPRPKVLRPRLTLAE